MISPIASYGILRRLALAVVRRYPAAWRERYEPEVSALLDDSTVQWRDVGELLQGMFTERARELVSSADNPKRTAFILSTINPVFSLLVVLLSTALGLVWRFSTGPWSPETMRSVVGFLLGVVVTLIVVAVWSWREWLPLNSGRRSISSGARVALLLLLATGILVGTAAGVVNGPSGERTETMFPTWFQLAVWWLYMPRWLTSRLFPDRKILDAFAALSYAETQIKTNVKWVEGCREMIARGVSSPLDEALAQVEHWTGERDLARARLYELSYRARFCGVARSSQQS